MTLANIKNKLMVSGLFFLICILITYCFFWLYLASSAKNSLASLSINNMKLDSFKDSTNISIKGFPFNIKILLNSISLDYYLPKKISLRSNNAQIIFKPWNPKLVSVHLPQGVIFLASTDGRKITTISSKLITINIQLSNDKKISSLRIFSESPKLKLYKNNIIFFANNIKSKISDLDANLHSLKPSILMSIENLNSSSGLINKLNSPITISHLEARLTHKFKNIAFHKSIAQWRDQGGTIEIDSLKIICDTLKINSSGTISIDDKNRPIAAFTAKTSGLIEFIDKLNKKNILTPTQAIASKVTAKIIGKKNHFNQLIFPVTIQYGKVIIGSISLFDLPDVYSIFDIKDS